MARTKSQAFPTGILLLAVAASAALLGYLVLSPVETDTAGELPGSADNTGDGVQFEFYDRLPQNEVQVNSSSTVEPAAAGARPDPGPTEIEQLAEQLTADSPAPLRIAGEALEQIAESIVGGLETPVPDSVAAPDPVPPVPAAPQPRTETVLAAPAPAQTPASNEVSRQSGTLLQSGAFSRREGAISELERQRGLGLEVEMRQRPGQNGPMFLLQSGPYDTPGKLEEAEMVFRLHNIPTARLSPP